MEGGGAAGAGFRQDLGLEHSVKKGVDKVLVSLE